MERLVENLNLLSGKDPILLVTNIEQPDLLKFL